MKVKDYKVKSLKFAEYNPRHITDKQFEQLKKSISKFDTVEPIIVNVHPDRKNVIVGGHMRARAALDLGIETFPCVEVNLNLEDEKELNVRLNKNTGEWDFDILANEFDLEDLEELGFKEYELGMKEADFSDKNKEIDIDSFEDEMILKLKFSMNQYEKVREKLRAINESAEIALITLLGI